jgi:hypothetical protein
MRDVSSGARLDEVVREMSASAAQADVRQVAGRLFQQKGGVWTEAPRPLPGSTSGQPEPRTVAIKMYSAAYFDVLEALPELKPLVAALVRVEVRGERVTLRFDGEGLGSIASEELRGLSRDFRGAQAAAPGEREEGR